ncbi:MAG: neutral/alkaline non-lysosomal ceramidase N-terminal domain-containing protein [Verrucomicrobia bacterium]|nr:neutral/alkaline non-lysosomal ceramidase N-terminal domain-containing protein [Verrucomicrobiota bacterium]
MKRNPQLALALIALAGSVSRAAPAVQPEAIWEAGVATADLTPTDPVWMGGYAGRNRPSDGVAQKVFAKALAIEDAKGSRFVIVTLDLVSVPRYLRETLEKRLGAAHGLAPESLLLNASHTHAAPELRLAAERTPYKMPPAMWDRLIAYRAEVEEKIFRAVGEALASRRPAALTFSHARAGFAMNRRRPMPKGGFSNAPYPEGPVDHDVPLLRVTGPDGKIRALLFGYACHNTTINGYKLSGDFAGHAQAYLEKTHPGATALFMQGCGGDQNPYPRQTMVPGASVDELAGQHGQALANAVSTALATNQRVLTGPIRAAYGHVDLQYRYLSDAELEAALRGGNAALKTRAQAQVKKKKDAGGLPKSYPSPVQVMRIGDEFLLVAIGQEVVVDYSLRLKKELKGPASVWIAGYSNDVAGYLGSRRVLEEGGYEGGEANVVAIGRANVGEVLFNRRPVRPDGTVQSMLLPADPYALPNGLRFGKLDPTMTVLDLRSPDGGTVATIFHLPAHAVSIYGGFKGLSADWPGAVVDRFKQSTNAEAIFMQGCAGDIVPWRRGPEAVDLMSRLLWERGTAAAKLAAKLDPGPLRVSRAILGLPPTADEQKGSGRITISAEVQVITTGSLALVALPGEPLNEISTTIQQRSPFPNTLVLGYSNGRGISYVGLPGNKIKGGYEMTFTGAGADEAGLFLVESAVRLLQEHAGQAAKP